MRYLRFTQVVKEKTVRYAEDFFKKSFAEELKCIYRQGKQNQKIV